MRKLLMPILKLFFNPNVLNQILHTQAQFNVDLLKREARRKIEFDRSRAEWNSLYYEVLHNLVLETTRMGIEVQNLRMQHRVAVEPPRFQRAPRPRARRRGPGTGPKRRRRARDQTRMAPAEDGAGPGAMVEGFVPGERQPGQAHVKATAAPRAGDGAAAPGQRNRGAQVRRCAGAQGAQVREGRALGVEGDR